MAKADSDYLEHNSQTGKFELIAKAETKRLRKSKNDNKGGSRMQTSTRIGNFVLM